MIPVRFTTNDLPIREQFDAWQGWFEGVFNVALAEGETGFAASSVVWTLDEFGLSHVKAPALTAMRDTALLRSNPIDHWVITLGGSRTIGSGGAGVTLDVPASVPYVASLGRELVSQRSHDERLQLYLPRDSFRELAPLLDAAQAQALDTPLGRLLGDYIGLLERSFVELAPADMPRLTNAVRAMVLACTGPSSDRLDVATSQINLTRRERVRQFIDRNLRDPGLDATRLCSEVGMSRTQLYRLFHDDGGVARYIRHRRLLRGYADLSDASNGASINVIADALCFEDASSFSRAFKQEFGLNPRDVRAAAAAGLTLRIRPEELRSETPSTLRECLLRF
ncbi:helix-turn-helix domain-containing protein [Bosea sp. 124]|uniref:helix-turn-helix domain-containing protein n=1 Tax=Bosea sp. 124 TaxID=2135642 RepID=UPI000D36E998|nr:helix-turn-helix domain-containing protein [Bosea sp. 124]